ncbi:homeobox protein NANOG [Orycteropus afer afer]|uniref:Homeobox protein NANOG n=1 Tax=Orycteropus afer afer TaxID=1230840 RepID=A0A8B6ZI90_ORYAF|nr:homeobox protein NANOG [Orycteropus afer afer]
MSVALASPQSLPEACDPDSRDSSPISTVLGTEENYTSLQMPSTEPFYSETVSPSPLPSSMDVLIQDSPDSSTSPKVKEPAPVENSPVKNEGKGQEKKQKVRTVFTQTQLCILKDRFQKQRYLSLQQMQELSEVLNLSYKQVKTWFQNQRMKCKRWQKNTNWSKNNNAVTQVSAPTEYLDLYTPYHQGCLPSGNFPMWSNQTWNSQTWSNQTWNSQAWSNQTWNSQAWSSQTWNSQAWSSQTWNNQSWNSQAWNNQFQNCGEEFQLPQIQFQQNSASDLEASQPVDLFLNYSVNIQPEDV